MAAIHDVLRYLLERVPHSTQDEHDQIAAVIDADQSAAGELAARTAPDTHDSGAQSTPDPEPDPEGDNS